jgi:hypothetical protein
LEANDERDRPRRDERRRELDPIANGDRRFTRGVGSGPLNWLSGRRFGHWLARRLARVTEGRLPISRLGARKVVL